MSRLSSLLVQDRVVSVGTMEQAFRRKDARGGRLGTNLLELGALDDATLQRYLSRAVELPSPPSDLLARIDDPALSLVEVQEALRLGAIPAAVEGDRVSVLVRDRLAAEVQAQLEAQLGRQLEQYVVAEFRFEHALAELYGVRPSSRAEALIRRFPAQIGRVGMSGVHPAVAGGEDRSGGILSQLGRGWTLEQLGRFLGHSGNRDDIVQALLGFARSHFPRAAVLAVQHGKLHGFAGVGMGNGPDALRGVEIGDARVLRDLRARGGDHTLVGLPQDLGLSPLYDALHLDKPLEVACFVLRVGSRPAMLLVADNDHRPLSRTAFPALEAAVGMAAAGLGRLLREKKKSQDEPDLRGLTAAQPAASWASEPTGDAPLVELDAGWELDDAGATEPHLVVTAAEDSPASFAAGETSDLGDTDPARPSAKGIDSGPRPAVDTAGYADADETPQGLPGAPLDDLMFGEIERLVEAHAADDDDPVDADEPAYDRSRTMQGFAGIGPEQIARAREARRAASAPLPGVDPLPVENAPLAGALPEEQPSGDYESPAALMAALLSDDGEASRQARAELLLAGDGALDALAEHFPGPIRAAIVDPDEPPQASRCGALLAVVVELGQRFAGRLWKLMESPDRNVRLHATLCCGEVRHPDNPPALAERVFDADPGVRRLAAAVLRGYRSSPHFGPIVQRLRKALQRVPPGQEVPAAEALAALGDTEVIPPLIELVDADSPAVAEAAQAALERLVFQSFGRDKKKWTKWYAKHGREPRTEWLLESIFHKSDHIRLLVAKAIARIPGLDVDLDPSAGKRDLKRVHATLSERFKDRSLAAQV